jgi:hypothetical protein
MSNYWVKVENGVPVEYHKVHVHTISMGDVDDPEIYIAGPLLEWQQSEAGRWIMEHSAEKPVYSRGIDRYNYGYSYSIAAVLRGKDYTYWTLKWGKTTTRKDILKSI